jgi:hypothetical protein
MRLKSEMHAIIGFAAAVAFLVIGVWSYVEVKRVHRVEVKAQGETMGLFLAKACAMALRGPSPTQELEALLARPGGEQDPPVVNVVVYDRTLTKVLARAGALASEAVGPDEDLALRRAVEAPPGQVQVQDGEELNH